jgi:hypothetical protein
MGLSVCSTTFGNALLAYPWMLLAQALAPAPGLWWEAQPLVTPPALMALKERREVFQEADGLPQRQQTPPGIFGFLAGKAGTPRARRSVY